MGKKNIMILCGDFCDSHGFIVGKNNKGTHIVDERGNIIKSFKSESAAWAYVKMMVIGINALLNNLIKEANDGNNNK